jgi:hypothetical protein
MQNPDGSWTVGDDLAVTNGNGITINSDPAGVTINPAWNGVDDVGIATDRVRRAWPRGSCR